MIVLNKEKYTSLELTILCFTLLNSSVSTLLINEFKNLKTIEIIISLLISFILGYPLLIMFIKRHFNEIPKSIIIKILLIFLVTIMTIFYTFYFSKLIKDILIPNESIYTIYILIIISTMLLSNKGMKSITIASNLFFILNLFIFIIIIFFNINSVNPINLLPISSNIDNLNFFTIMVFTMSPLFLIYIIPKDNINNKERYYKSIKKIYIIFYIYLITKILFIISILGNKYFDLVTYPEITIFKTINIFNLFERIEEILIINIFTTNIIVISLEICYINTLLKTIIKSKKIIYLTPLIIFILLINIKELNINIFLLSHIIFIIINLYYKKRKD